MIKEKQVELKTLNEHSFNVNAVPVAASVQSLNEAADAKSTDRDFAKATKKPKLEGGSSSVMRVRKLTEKELAQAADKAVEEANRIIPYRFPKITEREIESYSQWMRAAIIDAARNSGLVKDEQARVSFEEHGDDGPCASLFHEMFFRVRRFGFVKGKVYVCYR